MTLVSYLFGGGKLTKQEDLKAEFSGNVNKRLAIAAGIQYLYSRGNYDHQGNKDLSWQVAGSDMGDRYQMHAFANTYSFVSQENGGISDTRFMLESR